MKNYLPVALCFFILLTGCATPMVANLDKHFGQYVPTNDSSKGIIYFYRESEFFGTIRGLYVDVDGKRKGALNSGTYFVYEVDPGAVIVSIENRLGSDPSRKINIEAGKTYYVKGGIKVGIMDADPYINVMAEDEGKSAVQALVYATMKAKDLK